MRAAKPGSPWLASLAVLSLLFVVSAARAQSAGEV